MTACFGGFTKYMMHLKTNKELYTSSVFWKVFNKKGADETNSTLT